MFTVQPLPPQIDPALIAKLQQAEPATIGHFRHSNFMDPAIRAVIGDRRIAGTAVTLRVPAVDGTMVAYALGQARPGDILIIDRCGDRRHACWGGLVQYSAMRAGIAGAIIDGMATDFGEVREYGVPLWCRGPSAITTKRLDMGGDFCVPVSCGGVTVRPGDAIVADEMGIFVLDPAEVEAVATRAIKMQDDEVGKRAQLDAGEKLPDITGVTAMIEAA